MKAAKNAIVKVAFELKVRAFVKSAVIPSSSPLKSVFDSAQISGSFKVQDGGIALFPEKKIMIALQKSAWCAGYITLRLTPM